LRSEREKYYILAHYYDEVILDGDKASATYAEWRQTYPRDIVPYDNGALAFSGLGQHEKALDLASQAMRLDPKDAYAYANLSSAYEALNRFDEARSVAEQAVALKLDGPSVRGVLTDLAYIRGDWSAYDHYVDLSRGTANESFVLFFKALGQDGLGKVHAGRETWQLTRSELLAAGIKDFAGALFGVEAIDDSLLGYQAEGRRNAAQGLALSTNPDVRSIAANALASTGDVAKSASLVADLSREFPDNHFIHSILTPMVQAQQLLQQNQAAQAITALEPLRPYEFGVGPHGVGYVPNYLRGMAYLKLGDGVKAAAEFQRILDHRGVSATDPRYSLSHLNLGRAYALQGDRVKARTAYQDFFAAWKDADPDVPAVITAKAEYEKLK
jgi:eukaryotic-like serine/threonine-protein kinase